MRILDHVADLRSNDPDNPAYQVTFWGRSRYPVDQAETKRPFEAEVIQITDADVGEVLDWAEANAGAGRTYQVEVATTDHDTVTNLIRLHGRSPLSNSPQDPPNWFGDDPLRLA